MVVEKIKRAETHRRTVKVADLSSRWPAMCIHGDKSQPERDWVLSGTINTLADIHCTTVLCTVVLCCPEPCVGSACIIIQTELN